MTGKIKLREPQEKDSPEDDFVGSLSPFNDPSSGIMKSLFLHHQMKYCRENSEKKS